MHGINMLSQRQLKRALACLAAGALLLTGCQTPERASMREHLDQIQAENSQVKASADARVAQAELAGLRQERASQQEIEALTKRVEELSKKVEALSAGKPAPAPAEPPKEDPQSKAELEKEKALVEQKLKEREEQLARAQAQEEAAKAALATIQQPPKDGAKPGDWKDKHLPVGKFIDSNGQVVELQSFLGKQVVVVAVMKGFYSQGICIYCSRQTAELVKVYPKFKEAGAEVLVVYPGKESHIPEFAKSVKELENADNPAFRLPFHVLLDVNQDTVRALGIAEDLARPTTFVVDKEGTVRFEYLGRNLSDRPAAAMILDEVKKLTAGKP